MSRNRVRLPTLTVKSLTEILSLENHSMYAEGLAETHADYIIAALLCVNPYEPCLLDYLDLVLLVVFIPLASRLLPTLSWRF